MSTTEFTDLRDSIGQLRHCLTSLQAKYGDAFPIRRLANDVERLDIDAGELELSPPPVVPHREPEVVYVPDSRSDEAAWMGAQDEGLGFHSRERTK
jgi:hypothetical protein